MANEFIFVYGTLRQRARHPIHRQLRVHAEWHDEAQMQGCLFEVAGYPGAIESPDPNHRVKGELYRIVNGRRLLALLDDYEECSGKFPEPYEYHRKLVTIRTSRGDTVSAWAYIYQKQTTQLRKIPDGDYLRFLHQQSFGKHQN